MQAVFKALKQLRGLPSRVTTLERNVRRILTVVETHHRESQLAFTQLTLPDAIGWQPPVKAFSGPAMRVFPSGVLCRQDAFEQPYFHYWCHRIAESVRYHRKQWEFVFIAQAASERGLLVPGRRALGFGVGNEPLPALFAAHGVTVTATDMEPNSVVASGWAATKQHAASKESLRNQAVCSEDIFHRNVDFLTCDMNAVPTDLAGYDFCWSACALEHLGSIEKGLAFIEQSLDCLLPGGWAIHTTEFNLSSDTKTIDNDVTVLFRKCDLEDLIGRLRAKGHDAAAIDWDEGIGSLDQYVDLPPYRSAPHLKASIAGFRTTSLGLIVRKGGQS